MASNEASELSVRSATSTSVVPAASAWRAAAPYPAVASLAGTRIATTPLAQSAPAPARETRRRDPGDWHSRGPLRATSGTARRADAADRPAAPPRGATADSPRPDRSHRRRTRPRTELGSRTTGPPLREPAPAAGICLAELATKLRQPLRVFTPSPLAHRTDRRTGPPVTTRRWIPGAPRWSRRATAGRSPPRPARAGEDPSLFSSCRRDDPASERGPAPRHPAIGRSRRPEPAGSKRLSPWRIRRSRLGSGCTSAGRSVPSSAITASQSRSSVSRTAAPLPVHTEEIALEDAPSRRGEPSLCSVPSRAARARRAGRRRTPPRGRGS